MPTPTVENYLKQLYVSQQQAHGQLVSMGALATAMRVVPGTATSMIKSLADAGLVQYRPREGVRLTSTGESLALRVLRRHRLIELFLVQTLGIDWAEVHDEAEELEHAVSEKVLERIDLLLGRPRFDPHGDPIPTSTGKLSRGRLKTLADLRVGQVGTIARVLDQSPAFLQFVHRTRIPPGTRISMIRRDDVADSMTLSANGTSIILGSSPARKILVS
jgi:DtxR family Mn-dependent transcriptional regulator